MSSCSPYNLLWYDNIGMLMKFHFVDLIICSSYWYIFAWFIVLFARFDLKVFRFKHYLLITSGYFNLCRCLKWHENGLIININQITAWLVTALSHSLPKTISIHRHRGVELWTIFVCLRLFRVREGLQLVVPGILLLEFKKRRGSMVQGLAAFLL